MKKIGILTFHRANNYGAVLQAWATKQVLATLNYQVQIINYLCPQIEDFYSFFSGSFSFPWLVKKGLRALLLPKIIFRNKKFKQFRNKYLIDMPPVLPTNITKMNSNFDIFITGSDQVFNPRVTGFDKNYLLDFVQDNKKKYSYAASMGLNNCKPQEIDFLRKYLQSFSGLSVREKESSNLIGQLTGKPVFTHLDPTLLLNKSAWQAIAQCPSHSKPYILLYLMGFDKKILSFTKKLAAYTGLEVLYIPPKVTSKTPFKAVLASPQEWVGYFLNATYVVTNSFHGLAFAINFNKKFFVDFIQKGDNSSRNGRFENLLNLTNLKCRLIDKIGTNYDEAVDFEQANRVLQQEREKAIEYLRNIGQSNGRQK